VVKLTEIKLIEIGELELFDANKHSRD